MAGQLFLRVTTAAVLIAGVFGCSLDEGPSSPLLRYDSAGVEIVEIHPTTWPPPEAWQVSAIAELDIGVPAGDPAYELFAVQGAISGGEGQIVVAEWGATLRFFDRTGTHLRTLERDGEGPGEARRFMELSGYRGDSLALTTMRGGGRTNVHSLLILDQEAQFGRNVQARFPGGGEYSDSSVWVSKVPDWAQESLDDGSFVVRRWGVEILLTEAKDGVVPGQAALMRLSPEGTLVDTIDVVRISAYEHEPLNPMKVELMNLKAEAPPARAHGMSVFWTPGDRFTVNVYRAEPIDSDSSNPSTPLRESYRIITPLSPITEALRQEYIEMLVPIYSRDNTPAEDAEYRRHLNGLRSPDSLPAVQDLRIDAVGNLWLELYQMPGVGPRQRARENGLAMGEKPPEWVVLGPEGSPIGLVRTPPGLEITEIGADYILGLWADEYGVKHVRRHSITKPHR